MGDRQPEAASPPAFVVVHSSDVHVDDDYVAAQFDGDGAHHLRRVVRAATRLNADLLLLVGDTFDHNRLPSRAVGRAAGALAEFTRPIVILPGNHDPATEDAVFAHPALASLGHIRVLGVGCGEIIKLPELELEIWGRPHRDFGDMAPLAAIPPRAERWRIVLAHGHYEPSPDLTIRPRPYWLFGDRELAASEADYVALGHWNRAAQVGGGRPPAWYSGSPDYAGTVNLLRFDPVVGLTVKRERLED
jgi:DNA repair exonuclease SbcCD nuclease subunit